ncbi:Frd.2 conserved hypothetical protein [Escherichia phage vB_EcoM_VR7]|uniref:Uncharacterized protein frd.2 n=1 Tax=Escherichia phage vB_EcoM_VR7 TaxID=700939 RepID=E5FJ19_9CAUD|nr:hypothetical protein VR7_gp255 [Escherichia phage vB_EcoM_VR7]ADR32630.1 Frd.2 conserved hypothetical protein [Escherichia phage vB_EcoM_VR7]
METGKTYVLDPAAKKRFIADCPDDNALMVKRMAECGDTFKVLDMGCYYGEYFVEMIEMKDGTIFTSMDMKGEYYFELAEGEFQYFLEVDEAPAPVVDTQTIHVQVNHKNAAEVIALIKATFGI